MKSIAPYLNFNGKTEEAFNFYKSVFGGEFASLQRFKDMPSQANVSANEKEQILHIALPLGNVGMLMGSDSPESMGMMVNFGNNVHIMIDTESEQEAKRLYAALSAGGKAHMSLQKTFWGALYANFTDRFGVQWMVNYGMTQK